MAFSDIKSFDQEQWGTNNYLNSNYNYAPSNFLNDSWAMISESFDTDLLTKAFQSSLTSPNQAPSLDPLGPSQNANQDPYLNFGSSVVGKMEQVSPTGSGSDLDHSVGSGSVGNKRGRNVNQNQVVSNGRVSKRKSRASKRTPTTFITADPTNFRQMVQQVTGVRFSNGHGQQQQQELLLPVMPVKPEAQRASGYNVDYSRNASSCLLPTLDTSAYLLNNNTGMAGNGGGNNRLRQREFSFENVGEVAANGGGIEFDNGLFQSFPTLESWRVM